MDGQLDHFDILAAKKAYAAGENVTELLRSQKRLEANTPEIIETSYDLQAGTYIEYINSNPTQALLYASEVAAILDRYVKPTDSLLDFGTGELTTLSLVTHALAIPPKSIYAFDISWSRLYKGEAFAKERMGAAYDRLTPFVGAIGEIPLLDKSVNVTTSSHALEPNGGRLTELMRELFRVTADMLVLFEPCYEINSDEGKQRMERLGYIRNMDEVVANLGGKLVEKIAIRNVSNPLNPTVCFVITPPPVTGTSRRAAQAEGDAIFSVPGTNFPLRRIDDFYLSNDTGLCYPILKGIPVLRAHSGVLASALCE